MVPHVRQQAKRGGTFWKRNSPYKSRIRDILQIQQPLRRTMDGSNSDRKATNMSSADRLLHTFPAKAGSVVSERSSRRLSPKNPTILNMLITLKPVSVIDALETISFDDQTEKTASSTPEQHLASRWGTRESFVPQIPTRDDASLKPDFDLVPTRGHGASINFREAEIGSTDGKEFISSSRAVTDTFGTAREGSHKGKSFHRFFT